MAVVVVTAEETDGGREVSQSVSQAVHSVRHSTPPSLDLTIFVCTELLGPAKAARLPSHARPLLN